MDKYYLRHFEEPLLSKNLESYLSVKQKASTQLVVLLDRNKVLDDDFMKNLDGFLKFLSEKGIRPHDIIVAVNGSDKNYSASEWQKIKEVNEKLKAKSIEFGIEDLKKVWGIQEVENANNQIQESADKLRGKNLSPMEKLLSTYLEVTRKNYKFEDKTEHSSQSRSIYGVLNSDKIVCVGFAELLKAIMERDGDPNIKLYDNTVAVSHDNEHLAGYHRNLIVYIKDEKYGLDGYYYLDPTWDSAKTNKSEFKLNHFLLPLKDIQFISDHIRDREAKLEPEPKKTSSKPKHISNKTKKAIAKNKHRTYNAVVGGNSSFSSDKFVLNKPLQTHVLKNEPVADRLEEYFDLQGELFSSIEKRDERVDTVNEIKNYFIENNIKYLPYSVGDKLRNMIKNNASVEECIDYAESIVQKLRFGKSNTDPDAFFQEYCENLRKDLEKEFDLESDREFCEMLKTGGADDLAKEYETKIQAASDKIDTIIDVLTEMYKQDPESVFALFDSNTFYLEQSNFSAMINDLYFAGNTPEAIKESLNDSARLHMGSYSIDEVFVGAEYAAKTDTTRQTIVEDKQEDRRQKDILIYEALCDSSTPLTYNQLSRALTVVLSKNRPDLEPSEIASVVQKIMDVNTQRSKTRFTEGASNVFYQSYQDMKQAQAAQGQSK